MPTGRAQEGHSSLSRRRSQYRLIPSSTLMPIYEYRCPNGHVFEQFKRMSDPPPEHCEVCGASPLELVLYPVAIHYKGSGFYSTDYGKRKQGAKEGGDSGSSSGDSSSKSDSKSDSTPASDTKPAAKSGDG